MRHTAKRCWPGLVVGLVGLAGCAEDKGLPEKAATQENKSNPASIEAAKPEKEDPAAREIVTKAIAAHTGGKPERLDRIKAQHIVYNGTAMTPEANSREVDGTRESWSVWPDKFAFRFVYKFAPDRELQTNGALTNSGGFLRTVDGQTTTLTEDFKKGFRWDLVPLDWGVTPKALTHPEAIFYQPAHATVGGKAVSTVKAYIPGFPTWTLRFDDATHLLDRIDYIGYDGSVMSKSLVFSEHKEREGLKVPGRVEVYNGSLRVWDLRAIEKYETFESTDKIEPKKFESP